MTQPQIAYRATQASDCPPMPNVNCPTCLSKLAESVDALHCATCDISFSVHDGIVDLRLGRKDYYFNPVPRPQMSEIIEDITVQRWPRAVRRFIKEVNFNRDWIDNLVVDGRYGWKLFLDLPPGARVLDLGCGLGNLTRNIAPHVAEVYSLDLTWERLQFARRRFQVFNPSDRISLIAGGDGAHLPFADGTFDCVMLSGVLEWVPDDDSSWAEVSSKAGRLWRMLKSHFGRSNPRRVQLRFLEEIRRVLKPTGQVFIGIENRLDYEYFSGLPDHHSSIPYTSLMPRGLATLYSIAVARAPYRTYTYAYPGYRRLLSDAGFRQASFLGLTPGYSHLSEIIPFDSANGRWLPRPRTGWKQRIRTSKLCVPAYGIVGAKSDGHMAPSLLDRIAQEIERALGEAPMSLRFAAMRVTGKAKGIIRGKLGVREVVLRIPLNPQAALGEQANHEALVKLTSDAGELANIIPAPLQAGDVQNVKYFLEEVGRGVPMDSVLPALDADDGYALATRALHDMNPMQRGHALVPIEGNLLVQEVLRPFKLLAECVEDAALMTAAQDALAGMLAGARVRIGLIHGDFNPENLLVGDQRISAIIDWEYWTEHGITVFDAINFADGMLRMHGVAASVAESVAMMIDENRLPAPCREFLREHIHSNSSGAKNRPGLIYLYWLHHIVKQLGELSFDPQSIDERIRPVLKTIAAT